MREVVMKLVPSTKDGIAKFGDVEIGDLFTNGTNTYLKVDDLLAYNLEANFSYSFNDDYAVKLLPSGASVELTVLDP